MPGSHSKKDKLKKKVAKIGKKPKKRKTLMEQINEHKRREGIPVGYQGVKKADQQDINRVKRWNSRSFNKKKELSGTTEPVFKTTATIKPLTGRPDLGIRGDELTAKLRQRLAKIRKADGGIAPNYNNPSQVHKPSKIRKKKSKTASYAEEDPDRVEQIDKFMKNSPSGEKMIEDVAKNRKRFMDQAREMKGYVEKGIKINPSRRTTGKKIDRKLRKKLAKVKAAAKSNTGYMGDSSVNIPWGEEEVNITFRDMAQFHRKNMWTQKQGTYPQIWNLGSLTGEGQGARQIFDAAHDVENRFIEEMGEENYNKNMQNEISHLVKEYGEDPEGDLSFNEELTSTQDNLGLGEDVPQSRRNEIKRRQKKEKMGRQRKALRSAVNKGVNKVNVIKPTKAYKKPPQGPNPDAQTPKAIRKNAEVVGRDNASYIGKIKKKKKKYDLSKDDDIDVDVEREIARERMLERSQASAETQPQYGKIKKRIARIRKAGEQIDPRVKKRKTVRPDSPVQKVSQMKDRIAEMKTAKDHSHSIVFRKHEGIYYRRASLTKQEGKYAKYWLLNAKQTNGNGWGVSRTSIAKNIHKFIGRPFVITAKQWIPESEYGEQFEHPYLPTNNIENIISHQEKFRVGSIVDVIEKDGDYHAVIEINSKFANMMLPPFCSPAIFQNNPGEADGDISDWEALHLAGLMEDPAYGARIALLKGSCLGTAEACSIQFKAAKQTTMCPKKKAKLVRRLDRLGD